MFAQFSASRAPRTRLLSSTIACSLFVAMQSATAACVQPQGDYVGAGGGPAYYTTTGPTGTKTLLTGLMTMTVSLSLPSGGAGKIFTSSKMAMTPVNGATSYTYLATTGAASIVSGRLFTGLSAVGNAVDPVTCMGMMMTDESRVGPGSIQTLRRYWLIAVSDNGRVVTLSDFEIFTQQALGFPIRLERQ